MLLLCYLFIGVEFLHSFLFGLGDLQASLLGMVSGKAELKTDVPFTLDDGIDRINCIKLCYIVLPWRNWCKIYTKTISSPGLKPIDTLRISASCRCKVGWLVRVT
ncbi:uncharacterized protein LOC119332746 [Triticum dicoccoides]|uniref:uncharacterized protein LOC119332746 n=1 Tax=Triticum dicoccoides TaxID=85692 RepID=UPI001890E35C|nr:uncharacterized protein LOC119332746 [Triticum dicoccoides]